MEAEPPAAAAAEGEEEAEDEEDGQEEEEDEVQVEEEEEDGEVAALLERAQKLIARITSVQDNPNPRHIHALASMIEEQESRYIQDFGSSSNNTRSSHAVGKLGSLVRENDEFYELISSKFLSDDSYYVSIRAAAARLLVSCSSTWMHPFVFDDAVLDNIKGWVMEDVVEESDDSCNWIKESGINMPETLPTDGEMLKTYATGLLAMGIQVVEDVLQSGLSAKLMRYLRSRIFGDTSASQKDICLPTDKPVLAATSIKGREETRGRFRQVLELPCLDPAKTGDEGLLGDQSSERDRERTIGVRQSHREDFWEDAGESSTPELTDSSSEAANMFVTIKEGTDGASEGWNGRDLLDGKAKFSERNCTGKNVHDEDADGSARHDSSRLRLNRGLIRTRWKGRANEVALENERIITSLHSTLRTVGPDRGNKDINFPKNEDKKRVLDVTRNSSRVDANFFSEEEIDERYKECTVGSKDITDMVIRAIRAAEAEARAADAPPEAVRAAGDAAAEVVKASALEAWKSTNNEEDAVLAASKAASTVVDAAATTEALRNSSKVDVLMNTVSEAETDEAPEVFFIINVECLAFLREKYCIQCLEVLGEYVEALGPILKEKGVDVCLALLQRRFKDEGACSNMALLPDVLKLICVLAAHRKFAALFVDRGGVQRLLAVSRGLETFFGLSSCLFTIGSLQGIMERVCALPSDIVYQVVELGLQLLECSQDQARKNSAVFFASAFVFKAVLDAFDTQDGLQKMLNLLHGAASVRSGGNSGALGMPNTTLRNEQSPAEVLTASEKQIAYHTCVALRQYFRAHLILLVDSLRPNKNNRGVPRTATSATAAYKTLDISNEAMDAVFLQIQRDRKLGPAFVRAHWPAAGRFLASNGHIIMLELCQAPPVERYLHDLAQYALGVLHIITFVPYSRKLIVNATLSNDRVGMAVILDVASGAGYVDPEVIHPALNVLVNLVCPPPSITNKPSLPSQGQQSVSAHASNGPTTDSRERHPERNISDRNAQLLGQNETRERNGDVTMERGGGSLGTSIPGGCSQTAMPSGIVGDRRITLGPGSGCAGLAAQLEQGYRQAREAVRANNGIKVLLHLLHPRVITPPAALDCLRALSCRVLLGLARDEVIAHILTKLQVGKKLSELIRDSGSHVSTTDQGRWQAELSQVAIELIAIVTNSGRASTLAATDAAAPTLRRIERAAIAAATPITYHSRELLLLIHEHLQASGLTEIAAMLQKQVGLIPLPSLGSSQPPLHQTSVQEISGTQIQWPSGRANGGFLSDSSKMASREEDAGQKSDVTSHSSRKKQLFFSSGISQTKVLLPNSPSLSTSSCALKSPSASAGVDLLSQTGMKSNMDMESSCKSPILLPMKRKYMEVKDSYTPAMKRLSIADSFQSPVCHTPTTGRRSSAPADSPAITCALCPVGCSKQNAILAENLEDNSVQNIPGVSLAPCSQLGLLVDPQPVNAERMTLDSLVVQFLKHQHRQCPAPITTLPPLSLLHPHVCPEPHHCIDAPANVTARISTREYKKYYSSIHSHRRDRQFVYSRFRPFRTCRDDSALLSCITFLGSPHIATGSHSGEIRIFDSNNGNVLESQTCHQSPITIVQSAFSAGMQLLLSSSAFEVKLWDSSSISTGPLHSFEGCKAAHFSHSGSMFGAFSSEASRREVLLYDIETYSLELRLSDNNHSGSIRAQAQSLIHFSPSDTMLLWNGVLWDRRSASSIHRFDQFTDFGGGGFHPAGNEVVLNSEVWDLRKFKLLRSVPSLDQTVITFNSSRDVIYAILRRNLEDVTSAVHTRRVRHPLFPAFRTIDAVSYSDIATVQVDRCVLDFAADPTDSFVGVVAMDDHEEMYSSARLFEIGRRRPTDDDSDPDDGADSEEDEDDEENDDSEGDVNPLLGPDLDGDMDTDSDDTNNEDDDEDGDSGDEDGDGDGNVGNTGFNGDGGLLQILAQGDEDEDEEDDSEFDSSGGDDGHFDAGFGF